MIQPEPEGSAQGYPLVSVEVLSIKVKELQRSFRHSDTRRLSRSDKVLKLKNFKKDATLKLFKSTNQERYEHVGPEVTSSQDGKTRLCLVDDLKVDFEKAFDSVRWDYLDDVLKSFGFGIKWRSWISGCLDSAKGSILINGSPTSEFHFQKGLKQGDPLSPFLFILVMESLHLSLSRVLEAGLFKGININNSLSISHLFYADDDVFVGKWDTSNIKAIVNVLNCFYMASGLKINLLKSKLTRIGVSKEDIDSAASTVGCSTFSSPFHYLGVKVGTSMSRLKSWKDITAKVSSRLSKWKLKTLSIGGRLTLLKSVLTAIPIFHMSLFKVPAGILKELESIRMNFFNGTDKSERKMVWIGWDNILASKKNGGLGISSLYATNRSLLFKWVWRFLTQESSLWSRFIKAIHGTKGAAMDVQKLTNKGSIWYDLIHAFSTLNNKGVDLLSFMRRKLGNGERTLFWEDIWLGEVALKSAYPRIFALELRKDCSVAEKMSHSSLDLSFCRLPRGGIESEHYRNLCDAVSDITLPQMHDRWSWTLNASGEFSVSSVRNIIDDVYLPKSEVATRWVKEVPIKINILAWKISLDRLPTRANLSARGLEIPSILCPSCNEAVESSSHIFFSCSLSRQVMFKVCRWWDLNNSVISSYAEWLVWLSTSRLSKHRKVIFEGVCYVAWWILWRFRNQILFGPKHPRRDLIFDDIVQMSFLWISNRYKSKIDWNTWMQNPNLLSL
ncbi:RNA-directed DNA polymerase, eukaryota, reverse transcriptase zinc-binding domain protein [Tanacetum coccineum]|uniref:RNA-directed DNA polymerase, eukaryota, reverse transcriptase zinc-binding domain protein n=1 Tax=Tanacetum coccineum TaxID=301880 RepID=A0ABQ5J3U0_9ASTR